jgi:hypothetical protein
VKVSHRMSSRCGLQRYSWGDRITTMVATTVVETSMVVSIFSGCAKGLHFGASLGWPGMGVAQVMRTGAYDHGRGNHGRVIVIT